MQFVPTPNGTSYQRKLSGLTIGELAEDLSSLDTVHGCSHPTIHADPLIYTAGMPFCLPKVCEWLSQLDNTIVPERDTRAYIVWCYQRVKALNALGGPRMRVISGSVIKKLGRLPRLPDDDSEIVDWESTLENWLKTCDESGKVAGKRVVCGFISHRWLRPHMPCDQCGTQEAGKVCPNSLSAHPDDAQNSKAKALTKFLQTSDEMIEWHFWMDFAGIHQECTKRIATGIMSLPGYIACVEGCLMFLTPGYEARAWCRLERLLAYRFCPAYTFYVLTVDFPIPPNLDQLLPGKALKDSGATEDIHLEITDPCGMDAKITSKGDYAIINSLKEAALSIPIAIWPDIKDPRHQKANKFTFGQTSQELFFPNGLHKVRADSAKNDSQWEEEQLKRHRKAMNEFTKIMWMEDTTKTMQQMFELEQGVTAFMSFLQQEHSDAQLRFVIEAKQLDDNDTIKAEDLCTQYLSATTGGETMKGDAALNHVTRELEQTTQDLANNAFPRFLESEGCANVMDQMQQQSGAAAEGAISSTVWSDYNIAEDVGYWVNMFISMAETFPACIVISDMTIIGSPMFYVNDEFCKTTGYSKDEAQGRNCRFLQGPETEPESVEVICETLRQGIDCQVKLTNYKKSGKKFQNLLSTRPVHDSNGVYRFVIGVQFEVTGDKELKKRQTRLDRLLRLLPTTLEVPQCEDMRAKVVDEQ